MTDLPTSQPRQKSSARRTVVLTALAAVLALAVLGGWQFTKSFRAINGPQTAANDFLRANSDRGPIEAYAMTAPSFREETPETTWETASRRLHLGRFYAADWTDTTTTGDMTTLRGVLRRLDLPALQASIDLRRIDASWKIVTVAIENPPAAADQTTQTALHTAAEEQAPAQQAALQPLPQDGASPAQQSDPTVSPVMPVPRFGAVPGAAAVAPNPANLTLGHAGPPGTSVASGQVGPTCMGVLWPQGFHANRIDCPLYLKTQPGLTERCLAHTEDGLTASVLVTYLNYDPVTRQSQIDCRIGR